MSKYIALGLVLFAGVLCSDALAKGNGTPTLPAERAPRPEESEWDRPWTAPSMTQTRGTPISFGGVGPDGFAILDEAWTWDDGGADPLQGWYSVDMTVNQANYFRHITSTIWNTGTGNGVPAPILNGTGSMWVGAFENEADALCWTAGLGYGDLWCQRALSPILTYTGSGNVSLSLRYFNETEEGFDYTRVLLRLLPSTSEVSLNFDGFTGEIGLATNHPTSPPIGATYSDVINAGDLQGASTFQIVFELKSDANTSDQDGGDPTSYGPFGVDDVTLTGSISGGAASYNFDSGLAGWTPSACPAIGSFVGVRDLSVYVIEDPCECALSGKVLEFHNDEGDHPYGQYVRTRSNPVDVLHDVDPLLSGPGGQYRITAFWDQYTVMPQANGVFYRPGWDYYPFNCPASGTVTWSDRIGIVKFYYAGAEPVCAQTFDIGTDATVPGLGIEQIRFVYEVYASCDQFGVPPDICTGITNFTPIIDNVRIEFEVVPIAPAISFGDGTQYQDGFAQGPLLDPNGVGRADVTVNVNFGNAAPFILGDSLYITGPIATPTTRWDARLWFRIAKEGPGTKPSGYLPWSNALATNGGITGAELRSGAKFTYAWLDSFEQGTQVARNKYVSYLRELGNSAYNSGAGEFAELNEIIRDNVLVAGTGIEYFVTANFTNTPTENFTLPDTTGQFFAEFEILPGWILDGGTPKFPCLLYIDAFNAGGEFFIRNALNVLGTPHDKYDYLDASSNWKAPLSRGGTGIENNGVSLPQLLGYKAILLNTGTLSAQCMWPEDFILLGDWLTAIICEGNTSRQGFILNGDSPATILKSQGPAFLSTLGAVQVADSYSGFGDEDYCIRLERPLVGGKYGTVNSINNYDYDAFGNWCPEKFSFDVVGAVGAGVGNRAFIDVGSGAATNYAQVATQVDAAGAGNFRAVVDGVSYHHISERDAIEECVADSAHIVTATYNEIAAALEWIFAGTVPTLCDNPCTTPTDVPGEPILSGVTRLYQNSPNPFHPRTVLRFSLAAAGNAALKIFDVNGRLVRTLTDGRLEGGAHELVWDGTDDVGHAVPSGVYWSQLAAGDYVSNKKMVVLR